MNEIEKAKQEITEAREKLTSAEARLFALSKPVEREYRAGEWVPDIGKPYYYVGAFGVIGNIINRDNESDVRERCKYPNRAIAEAAKAHADWWREFDTSDEGGGMWTYSGYLAINITGIIDSTPRYKTKESAFAAIERLGGEQKVIDMLNKGRVFRFKWGGRTQIS